MAEESVKHIHIEGADEEKKAQAESAEACEAEAEEAAAAAEEPEAAGKAEAGADAEDAAADDAGDGDKAEADDKTEAGPSAEEQESERYMRLMAEFQNFKRRAAKEKSDIHAFANERIVGDLLPVLDNFERALETETDDIEAYSKGMQLIFEQLKTALEKAGVKEIEALGLDFDPNVHNAVMTDNSDEYEADKISKVLQKGYKLNDKVVRPSMVAVNKK